MKTEKEKAETKGNKKYIVTAELIFTKCRNFIIFAFAEMEEKISGRGCRAYAQ